MNSVKLPSIDQLIFYKDIVNHPIMKSYLNLMNAYEKNQKKLTSSSSISDLYFTFKSKMLAYTKSKENLTHYDTTSWGDFIISLLLFNENPMTSLLYRAVIKKVHPSFKSFISDLDILCDLYHFDWDSFLYETRLDSINFFNAPTLFPQPPFNKLVSILDEGDSTKLIEQLNTLFASNGYMFLESHHFFYLGQSNQIIPVQKPIIPPYYYWNEFVSAKALVDLNTKKFLENGDYDNILLMGKSGTGKTTLIQSLLETFRDSALRIIKIDPLQYQKCIELLEIYKTQEYKFIFFIDNLTSDNQNYIQLMEALKGLGMFYATTSSELSMQFAFDLVIPMSQPTQQEYLEYIEQVASQTNLNIPRDRLKIKALQWKLQHLDGSIISAQNFIKSLIKENSDQNNNSL